jgi:hypothetical protein
MHLSRSSSWRISLLICANLLATPTLFAQTRDSLQRDSTKSDSVLTDSALAVAAGYRRSTRTAVILGAVVPGAGYLYAGEWLKSYPTFVATTGGLWVGGLIFQWDRCTFNWSPNCRSGVPIGARITGAALAAGGIFIWVRSAIDAGDAVERERGRRGRTERFRRAAKTTVAPCRLAPEAWCMGLSVATRE